MEVRRIIAFLRGKSIGDIYMSIPVSLQAQDKILSLLIDNLTESDERTPGAT